MTTIIRAAAASDFLALVPRLTGFHPRQSIVVIPFRGTRTMGAIRVDLPPEPAAPDVDDNVAATLVGMVCRISGADGMTPIVYTDEAVGAAGPLPRESLLGTLRGRADACGIDVTDALCVGADGWASYLDPARSRHHLSEIRRTLSDVPAELREVAADQYAGARRPPLPRGARKRVAAALRSLTAAVDTLRAGSAATEAEDAASALSDPAALFEAALHWDPADLEPLDAAVLVWCLDRPALRDIALTQWAFGLGAGRAAVTAQQGWEAGAGYPPELARHMWGDGPRPDPHRLVRALELVRFVAALAPRRNAAGPLALAAWMAWALGRSTHSGCYVRQALSLDPEHGLAGIMATIVAHGHLPEWAFTARESE